MAMVEINATISKCKCKTNKNGESTWNFWIDLTSRHDGEPLKWKTVHKYGDFEDLVEKTGLAQPPLPVPPKKDTSKVKGLVKQKKQKEKNAEKEKKFTAQIGEYINGLSDLPDACSVKAFQEFINMPQSIIDSIADAQDNRSRPSIPRQSSTWGSRPSVFGSLAGLDGSPRKSVMALPADKLRIMVAGLQAQVSKQSDEIDDFEVQIEECNGKLADKDQILVAMMDSFDKLGEENQDLTPQQLGEIENAKRRFNTAQRGGGDLQRLNRKYGTVKKELREKAKEKEEMKMNYEDMLAELRSEMDNLKNEFYPAVSLTNDITSDIEGIFETLIEKHTSPMDRETDANPKLPQAVVVDTVQKIINNDDFTLEMAQNEYDELFEGDMLNGEGSSEEDEEAAGDTNGGGQRAVLCKKDDFVDYAELVMVRYMRGIEESVRKRLGDCRDKLANGEEIDMRHLKRKPSSLMPRQSSLRSSAAGLLGESGDLMDRVQELEDLVHKQEGIISRKEETIKSLQEYNDQGGGDMEQSIMKKDAAIKRLNQELSTMENKFHMQAEFGDSSRIKQVEAMLEESNATEAKLQAEIFKMRKQLTAAGAHAQRSAKGGEELKRMQEEMDQTREEMLDVSRELEDTKAALKESQESKAQLEVKMERDSERMSRLKGDLERQSTLNSHASGDDNMSALRDELTAEVEEARDERDQLKTRLHTLEDQNRKLMEEKDNLASESHRRQQSFAQITSLIKQGALGGQDDHDTLLGPPGSPISDRNLNSGSERNSPTNKKRTSGKADAAAAMMARDLESAQKDLEASQKRLNTVCTQKRTLARRTACEINRLRNIIRFLAAVAQRETPPPLDDEHTHQRDRSGTAPPSLAGYADDDGAHGVMNGFHSPDDQGYDPQEEAMGSPYGDSMGDPLSDYDDGGGRPGLDPF